MSLDGARKHLELEVTVLVDRDDPCDLRVGVFVAHDRVATDGRREALPHVRGANPELPVGGHANPMTYMGKDGKQYVVINAGGQGGFGTGQGDYYIAYRLKS